MKLGRSGVHQDTCQCRQVFGQDASQDSFRSALPQQAALCRQREGLKMNAPKSHTGTDTFKEHTRSLRRLSADIARFRDPNVQAALEQIPVTGTASSPIPKSSSKYEPLPADDGEGADTSSLQALLFAQRAELRQISKERDLARSELEACSGQLAAAEQASSKLRTEVEVCKKEAERKAELMQDKINDLATDRRLLTEDSIEKTALLQKLAVEGSFRMEESQTRSRQNENESPVTAAEHFHLKERCERYERQLEESRAEAQEQRRINAALKDGTETQLRSLQDELRSNRNSKAALLADHNVKLKQHVARESELASELAATKLELASRMQELATTRKARVEAESQLFSERFTPQKRPRAQDSENVQRHPVVDAGNDRDADDANAKALVISRLKNELSQLSGLVRALSPCGTDLSRGLSILRGAARESGGDGASVGSGGPIDAELRKQLSHEDLQKQHRLALARLNTRIAEMNVNAEEGKNQLKQVTLERDTLAAQKERVERLGRILQRKSDHQRMALDEIERAAANGDDETASALKQALERAERAESEASQYRTLAQEFESELRESEGNAKRTSSELLSLQTRLKASSTDSVDGLRAQLLEATREAAGYAQERDATLEKLKVVEKELEAARSAAQSGKESSVELDYDPNVLKVLRLKAGLGRDETASTPGLPSASKAARVEGPGPSDSATASGAMTTMQSRIAELEEINRDLQMQSKVGERTKEIAKRKIEEVRQACCNLFGWTMKINGAMYRLTSIYAEDREDELVFGMGEGGAMNLHENGYTSRISDDVEMLVNKWKSVPALLASLTMSNFEKTTVAVDTSGFA